MNLDTFLQLLHESPEKIQFSDTISTIEENYIFSATAFTNGSYTNEKNQNNGSCKIFSFAKLHNLTPQQTLNCFGEYYRSDVLKNPQANDHQNIRNFMQYGWKGINFKSNALTHQTI